VAYWLSEPIEKLVDAIRVDEREGRCKVLVVGSGYGGAVAALRLAADDRRVLVLERGKEYALGDFPENLGELPGHVRLERPGDCKPRANADALFDLRLSTRVAAVVANGLGGGSLINANVALEADEETLRDKVWPASVRDDLPSLRAAAAQVRKLLGIVTDPQVPGKLRALRRVAEALGAPCEPAPVAVSFQGGRNAVGIDQAPCVRCGNCVTGCNTGSKNTLPMNLLPLAKARGARFYTGATVLSVAPARAGGWRVRFRRTATLKGPLSGEIHELHADDVVLAAGTLGSTEILLRSQALGTPFSAQLGARFSTNGDTLEFGYAQRARVGAVAASGSLDRRPKSIGPTISGCARVEASPGKGETKHRFLLQDGAIPDALRRVFGELVVTGSLFKRYVKDGVPAWQARHPEKDPLGVHPDALQHCQVLLGMGDDGAEGSLALKLPVDAQGCDAGGSVDDARLAICWPEGEASWANAHLDALARNLECVEARAFDGGDYVQNPFSRPLPAEFASALTGEAPAGPFLTVHPLGGCAMGESAAGGVVDGFGRVFRPGGGIYPGLHVMDGAVMPRALGVNPFLSICAIAWRACDRLLKDRGWQESSLWTAGAVAPPRSREHVPTRPEQVGAALVERLVGDAGEAMPEWFRRKASDLGVKPPLRNWLAAQIRIDIPDLDAWIADPDRPLEATCELFVNRFGSDAFTVRRGDRVASAAGGVRLLARDGPRGSAQTKQRMLAAFSAYGQRQGAPSQSGKGLSELLAGLARVARGHAQYRMLDYRFTFQPPGETRTWVLKGCKQLAYSAGMPNVWTALIKLPVELYPEDARDGNEHYRGLLAVDLADLAQQALLRVQRSAHLPATILALGGAGMLFLRVLFQTHFWSFAAPDYPARRPAAPTLPGPIRSRAHGVVRAESVPLRVPSDVKAGEMLELRLSAYHAPAAAGAREPVLLIHGLAHGANVFATDSIEVPLAAYLYDQGYEPWLLDHRLSPALEGLAERPWTMDQIAEHDIPAAVDFLYRRNGGPVNVFAHCIGAGSFSMSVLAGHCHDKTADRSKIKAAAIHAVPPWVVPSQANRLRANLAAFVKDVIGDVWFDPVPPAGSGASFVQTAIDRLAGSLPWPDADALPHDRDRGHQAMGQAICNRMTLFYGVEWVHGNLAAQTHRRISELVGTAHVEIFRQIFFIAQRERLTARNGENLYLKPQNISGHWLFPTLFAHGSENRVFSPRSSSRYAAMLETARQLLGGARIGPSYWREVAGYGHMDFLFGERAHRDVYPLLAKFFDPVHRPKLAVERKELARHGERLSGTLAGPVLGWARADPAGATLRIWVEAHDAALFHPTDLRFQLVSADGVAQPLAAGAQSGRVSARAASGRYWYLAYDVQVPRGASALRVFVLYGLGDEADLEERPAGRIELDRPWFRRLAGLETSRGCSFLAGSCRYPGTPFERDAADAVFEAMAAEVRRGADHVLLAGDQIYADATADVFDTGELWERYEARYRDAFKSPGMGRLLASVPVYMAVDDHEFGDDWEGMPAGTREELPVAEAMARGGREDAEALFLHARTAAFNYLRAMGPDARKPQWADRLWYEFSSAGLPFFVMDTRSERRLRTGRDGPQSVKMMCLDQLRRLREWLAENRGGQPKFIVCGSPIAPVHRDAVQHPSLWRNGDGWFGYPSALQELARIMVELQPRNVVFVAGDYHLSAVASLAFYCQGAVCVEARQIVASGLYAPMPFANDRPEDYALEEWTALPIPGTESSIGVRGAVLAHGVSHFLRVRALPGAGGWSVTATAIDAAGVELGSTQVL